MTRFNEYMPVGESAEAPSSQPLSSVQQAEVMGALERTARAAYGTAFLLTAPLEYVLGLRVDINPLSARSRQEARERARNQRARGERQLRIAGTGIWESEVGTGQLQ